MNPPISFKTVLQDNKPFFQENRPIFSARAPGRLDVMGGIADYSGSLVLEMPIAESTWAAVQLDVEPCVRILSLREGDASQFTFPLARLEVNGQARDYAEIEATFKDSAAPWAAYIGGVLPVLMREKGLRFNQGCRICVQSSVPEGKGVSSSAALEVATIQAIGKAFEIPLDLTEVATLCQIVENRVAGAPCGIMDQMTVVYGRPHQLLALRCQPAIIEGYVPIPEELAVWGIDSGIRHAVSGADYGQIRVGAFMGVKILREALGDGWDGYLANLSPSRFEQSLGQLLPASISGEAFLDRYGDLPDAVTTVDRQRTYAVRQPTAHPIYENFRVEMFRRLLAGDPLPNGPLLGELMFQSHASYSTCGLGSKGTDRLVELVREIGLPAGLYGAKITGGGSGGTVAVLGRANAGGVIAQIAERYSEETNYTPYIFTGSSNGSLIT
ncbi:MAG: galactokinase family protein [Chloroflexota bacterium]